MTARRRRSTLLKDLSGFVQALFELAQLFLKIVLKMVVTIEKVVAYLSKGYDKQERRKYREPTGRPGAGSGWSIGVGTTELPGVNAVMAALTSPAKLWSRTEVLHSHTCPVPKKNGLYGWYFRSLPDQRISVKRCVCHDGCYLLYVGIAPRNEQSTKTLIDRIKGHYKKGNSTLRQSLGSLLAQQLGLRAKNRELVWNHGDRLSKWMSRNAFVVWIEHPRPWDIEVSIIQKLDLPLNIQHNGDHPFCATLKAARKHHKDMAIA